MPASPVSSTPPSPTARAAAQGDDVEFDHLKADALVGLITGARTTGHRIPDLTLLTDSRTMRDGSP